MSSTYYGGNTDRHVELIQAKLQHESYHKTILWSFLNERGYIEPMPIGLKKIMETKVNEADGGLMSFNEEEFDVYSVRLEQKNYKVLLIGKTLSFGRRELQAWLNSSTPIGKDTTLKDVAIAEYQQKLYLQLDGFAAYGTNMRYTAEVDRWAGTDTITGIFNGFTTSGAGADEDNNVNAAYDYQQTLNNFKTDLREAGFDATGFWVFSSIATKDDVDGGSANHRIATYNFATELGACLAKPEILGWFDSPSFTDYAATANKIAMIPEIPGAMANISQEGEQEPRSKPFKIYQEPIQVYLPYGGNADLGGRTYIQIYTALAWAQTNTDAVVHSGALTFTAP